MNGLSRSWVVAHGGIWDFALKLDIHGEVEFTAYCLMFLIGYFSYCSQDQLCTHA